MLNHERVTVLVLSGHDPSGGAGTTADVRAIEFAGGISQTVITALTVQNHQGFEKLYWTGLEAIEQLKGLLGHTEYSAIKVGLVPSLAFLKTALKLIQEKQGFLPPVIWDPVLGPSNGSEFHTGWPEELLSELLAKTSLWTPNIPEIQKLGNYNWQRFLKQKAMLCPVLLKGGHGEGEGVSDELYHGTKVKAWDGSRLPGTKRGTGCVLSALIATELAKGSGLEKAIETARNNLRTYWVSSQTELGTWN